MAFCKNCGAFLADGITFCATCGTQNGEAANNAQQKNGAEPGKKKKNFFVSLLDTKNYTASFDPTDIQNNKVLALFSYIGLLFLIPLFAAKDSRYAKFHVNQGIVFCIAGAIVGAAIGLLGLITYLFALIHIILGVLVGMCCGFIAFVLWALTTGYTVLGIINAVTGKAKELPFIGKYRILK